MYKQLIKSALGSMGLEIKSLNAQNQTTGNGYKLHEYLSANGSFDYEKYRQVQVEGNKNKIGLVWVVEENIAFLSNYIHTLIKEPKFGICHGTRRGKEQEWFRKYLNCEVIGTEISETAQQFPHTIQWDFHKTKPEWIDAVDFIYSNSFDHSYDPQKCLNTWMSCLKKDGLCILEHSSLHGPSAATELDPFGAELVYMPYLIALWGEGRYGVRQILKAPKKNEELANHFGISIDYLNFIVIQKF